HAIAFRREDWRCDYRPREGDRQLRQEGPSFRRARRAGSPQRQDAAGALPPHRDLPAARAGSGVGGLARVTSLRAGASVEMGMFKSALLTCALTAVGSLAGIFGLAVAPVSAQPNAKPEAEL